MIHRIVLLLEAKGDIVETERYLQQAGPDVLLRFRQVITLRRVRERPRSFPRVWRDVRRAQTRPFKHGVFFMIGEGTCTVVAIVDLRRHPRTWQRRH